MQPGRRIRLLPLSLTAILCSLVLFASPKANGSCGNYLHSRLGPPTPYAVPLPPEFSLQASKTALARSSGLLPLPGIPHGKPCSGPHCGRSPLYPQVPPAPPTSSVSAADESANTSQTPSIPANPRPERSFYAARATPQRLPQPIEIPPEC